MMVCTPISTCTKNVTCVIGSVRRQLNSHSIVYASKSNSFFPLNGFQAFESNCFGSRVSKRNTNCLSLTFKNKVNNPRCIRKTSVNFSNGSENVSLRLLGPKQTKTSKIKCNMGPVYWKQRNASYTGIFLGLLVCSSVSEPSYSEAIEGNEKKGGNCDDSSVNYSHGKKVLTDYSVIGIPGDGRCLFRSVAHGACLRSGKPAPSESLQRELADELRARVADEFVKRREETEWFIEGDFETYVSQIRKAHVWGGEPELLMASHVLQMPITVYMHDQDSGGLISIAEYGQEYGKDNPIKVLYHGFGHYDALQIPGKGGPRSKL